MGGGAWETTKSRPVTSVADMLSGGPEKKSPVPRSSAISSY